MNTKIRICSEENQKNIDEIACVHISSISSWNNNQAFFRMGKSKFSIVTLQSFWFCEFHIWVIKLNRVKTNKSDLFKSNINKHRLLCLALDFSLVPNKIWVEQVHNNNDTLIMPANNTNRTIVSEMCISRHFLNGLNFLSSIHHDQLQSNYLGVNYSIKVVIPWTTRGLLDNMRPTSMRPELCILIKFLSGNACAKY